MTRIKLPKKFILAAVLTAATFLAGAVFAQTPYDEGQKALRERDWTTAASYFAKAIETDTNSADASMYWRAYALYQAGRKNEAERQLRSLERSHPNSSWVKEAQALQMEHEGSESSLAATAQGEVLDEELRMFALSQLMQRNPERALPLVLDLMNNTTSESVRRNAFFMLGMSDDPSAQQAIAKFARDSQDPELQIDAIHMLGIASNAPSMELLSTLYQESSNPEVKEAVIQAYIVGDAVQPMVQLLETETEPELQSAILHGLGVMDATSEIQRLYPTLSSMENRVAALQAFGLAGDTQALRQVLETETNAELRTAAIQGIAMEGGSEAAGLLESLYDNADSNEEKRAVVDSLMLIDEGQALALKIIKTETDVELRRQAIHALGAMQATADLPALYASIDVVELRQAILESMSIADDTDGLIALLESETDPELRSAAIQVLTITDDSRVADYLESLYPQATNREKQAIIQSMMIMDNAPGLIGLLNLETNPELKRQMVQLLASMESEETEAYLFHLLEDEQ